MVDITAAAAVIPAPAKLGIERIEDTGVKGSNLNSADMVAQA
jgi:hypothetical protein